MARLFSRLLRRLSSANRPRLSVRRARPAIELLEDRLTPTVFFQPQLGFESPVPGHNGPTLSSTPVHLIFEGSYWQSPTGITQGDVIQSAQNVLNSSYLSYATQYRTNGQAFLAGTAPDNSLPLSNGAFSESDLQTVAGKYVQEQVNAPSARGLYFVVTAPGVTDATRSGLGGFHNELAYNAPFPLPFDPGFRVPEEVPFGWVSSGSGTRQAEIDNFSELFSHELVESVTDPYIRTNDANRYTHGTNFQSSETFDEVGDFEPDGARYTYRLGNGTLVQAYWDQKDQQFVVPDGTAQTFTLTPRYAKPPVGSPNQTDFLSSFNLTVNGDGLADKDDRFTVQAVNTVASGLVPGVRVTLNGEAVTIDPGKLANLTLNTLTGDDAVDVESLPEFVNLTVNLGAGHDAVTLGLVSGRLDGLAGNVTINGGGANSTLTANDSSTNSFNVGNFASLPSVAWYVTGNSIARSDLVQVRNLGQTTYQKYVSNVTYSGLGQIDLFGGHCPNNYFLATDALGTPVAVHGTGANNQLSFYDSVNADNAGTVYTLTAGQITRVGTDLHRVGSGLFFFTHHTTTVQYDNVPAVNVSGGPTGNVVDVNGIGAGTLVTLIAGTGVNTINVGSAAASLDAIQGGLYVNSAGTDTLVLNDTAVRNYVGTVNAVAFAVSGTSVVRTNTITVRPITAIVTTGGGHSFSYTNTAKITYTQPHSLVIEGGPTGNTFTVQTTACQTPTTIDAGAGNDVVNVLATNATGPLTVDGAGGNDLVRVGSVAAFAGDTGPDGGKLANVQGAVTVLNSAGTATLVIDDSGDPAAYGGVHVASGSLTGLGGAAAIHWSGTPTRLYLGGTAGQAGNTVSVDASVSGGLPEIFSGPGNDTFTVLHPSVNNTLTVHGEGGNDTVNVIDPNAADAVYAFDGTTLTRTGHNADGTVSGVFTLLVDGIANVQVNGAAI
jgi:hypothetical protein